MSTLTVNDIYLNEGNKTKWELKKLSLGVRRMDKIKRSSDVQHRLNDQEIKLRRFGHKYW